MTADRPKVLVKEKIAEAITRNHAMLIMNNRVLMTAIIDVSNWFRPDM